VVGAQLQGARFHLHMTYSTLATHLLYDYTCILFYPPQGLLRDMAEGGLGEEIALGLSPPSWCWSLGCSPYR
jgi:hypothetical protein